MKLTLNICDDREEIVIYAKEKSPLVCEIEKLIKNYSIDIIGYNNGAVIKLPLSQIYCFSVEENKIFVYTQKEPAKDYHFLPPALLGGLLFLQCSY